MDFEPFLDDDGNPIAEEEKKTEEPEVETKETTETEETEKQDTSE